VSLAAVTMRCVFARIYDQPDPFAWTPRHVSWPPPERIELAGVTYLLEPGLDLANPGRQVAVYHRIRPPRRRPPSRRRWVPCCASSVPRRCILTGPRSARVDTHPCRVGPVSRDRRRRRPRPPPSAAFEATGDKSATNRPNALVSRGVRLPRPSRHRTQIWHYRCRGRLVRGTESRWWV